MPSTSRDLAWPWFALLAAVLAVIVAVTLAEPIQDGDLFWHLAYARQIVNDHTLSPDPSIYSWTPTSDAVLYVAWLAELVLYGIWRATGLTGLFVLRFVVAVGSLLFLARYAWRLGIGRRDAHLRRAHGRLPRDLRRHADQARAVLAAAVQPGRGLLVPGPARRGDAARVEAVARRASRC